MLDDDIHRYWIVNHPAKRLKWIQSGGGYFKIDGHLVEFRRVEDSNEKQRLPENNQKAGEFRITQSKETVFVVTAGGSKDSPCFVLELVESPTLLRPLAFFRNPMELDFGKQTAVLQNVRRRDNCQWVTEIPHNVAVTFPRDTLAQDAVIE